MCNAVVSVSSVNFNKASPYVSGCNSVMQWVFCTGLCSYGLADSRLWLTATVYRGYMCSSSYHMVLLETGGAYVAPSVGIILATASHIDIHLQGYFYCTCSLMVSWP